MYKEMGKVQKKSGVDPKAGLIPIATLRSRRSLDWAFLRAVRVKSSIQELFAVSDFDLR